MSRAAGGVTRRSDRDVRRAWWCFGLFLPSFVGSFVTGEGLLTVLGRDGEDVVPARIALAAGVPAMVVFALPAVLIGHLARRAVRNGHQEGLIPAMVASLVVGGFVAVNLVQLALVATLG